MRILIVDDDPVAGALLKDCLAPYAECDVCWDGNAAARRFEEALDQGRPYHLVCMDIVMPVMDGHETVARLREIETGRAGTPPGGIKVAMITAMDDMDNTMSAFFDDRAVLYITKPVNRARLLADLVRLHVITPLPLSLIHI